MARNDARPGRGRWRPLSFMVMRPPPQSLPRAVASYSPSKQVVVNMRRNVLCTTRNGVGEHT